VALAAQEPLIARGPQSWNPPAGTRRMSIPQCASLFSGNRDHVTHEVPLTPTCTGLKPAGSQSRESLQAFAADKSLHSTREPAPQLHKDTRGSTVTTKRPQQHLLTDGARAHLPGPFDPRRGRDNGGTNRSRSCLRHDVAHGTRCR
jgi:hypothetical protein